jgi:hypothetical protein
MSTANYAILDYTKTIVTSFQTMDTAVFAALPAAQAQYYRIVNMTTSPAFDPATQYTYQNGWIITANDIEPVWITATATPAQQQTYSAQQLWATTLQGNLITAFNNYISTAVPSQAQTNAIVLQLVKCIKALLQMEYSVTN